MLEKALGEHEAYGIASNNCFEAQPSLRVSEAFNLVRLCIATPIDDERQRHAKYRA